MDMFKSEGVNLTRLVNIKTRGMFDRDKRYLLSSAIVTSGATAVDTTRLDKLRRSDRMRVWQINVTNPKPITVGRSIGNNIRVDMQEISKSHALITCAESKVYVVDSNSTNGTFMNGKRLEMDQPETVKTGDEIRFGDKTFTIRLD